MSLCGRRIDEVLSFAQNDASRFGGGDVVLDEVLERVAYAEVRGHDVARLHPAEDPGDGAEVFHAALAGGAGVGALGGAGADARVFELGDGRGLLEVGEGLGVFDDVFAIEGVGGRGELVEGGLPLGEDLAGEVGGVARRRSFASLRMTIRLLASRCCEDCVGAGDGVERGGDHQFEIALGEDDVGVLPVEDFALLGDAQLAGEAVHRLREDGAVRGSAAAAYGAAAAVEEAQRDAALAGDLMQRAVGLPYLPGAGDHAAVFVGVGVAEHDLLLPVPGFEQRLVGRLRSRARA